MKNETALLTSTFIVWNVGCKIFQLHSFEWKYIIIPILLDVIISFNFPKGEAQRTAEGEEKYA